MWPSAERGQDRGDRRLADVAAAAACRARRRARRSVRDAAARATRSNSSWRLSGEVLAQRRVDARARGVELGVEQLLDQRHAAAAARAGPGARLDAGDVGAALLGDRAQIAPLVHVVARADLRVVGQRASRAAAPLDAGEDQLAAGSPAARCRWRPSGAACRTPPASPTRMPPSSGWPSSVDARASCRRPRPGRRRRRSQRALGRGERVAEARHVDAEQLELGRHVGAGEARRPAEQARRRRPRPSRSRARPGRRSGRRRRAHSPIAKMSRVGGAAALVDDDAAALADRRGRQSRASSSRGRMPAEKTTMSTSSDVAVGELHAARPAPSPRDRRGRPRRCGRVTPSSSIVAHAASRRRPRRAARGISRGANSTTWVSRPSSRSALAASSPSRPPPITAPRRGWPRAQSPGSPRGPRSCGRRSSRPGRGRARAARTAPSRWRGPARRSAMTSPPLRRDRAGRAVDRRRPASPSTQPHPRVVVPPCGQQRQLVGAAAAKNEVRRDPVVRRPRLLADDDDVVASR